MIRVYVVDLTLKRPSGGREGLFKAAANISLKAE